MKPDLHSIKDIHELLAEASNIKQSITEKKMMLAARISDAIEARKITKPEFGQILSESPAKVDEWLSGTYNFSLETLLEIEYVLNVKLINI